MPLTLLLTGRHHLETAKKLIMIMFTEQKGRAFKLITPCASIFGAILMIMSQYINQKWRNLKEDGQGVPQ